jgi:hypothetical protein
VKYPAENWSVEDSGLHFCTNVEPCPLFSEVNYAGCGKWSKVIGIASEKDGV